MKRAYTVGIDIGTTNCAVAVAMGEDIIRLVQIYSEDLLQSIVNFRGPDNIRVGGRSFIPRDVDKGTVVFCNKLVLGHQFDDPEISGFKELCRAKVVKGEDDLCEFEIPGFGNVSPERVVQELLKVVMDSVIQFQGGQYPSSIWLSIPATFTQIQRGIMRRAAQDVIKDCDINFVSEPSAAALSYGLCRILSDGYYVIYDLGGGTFDVSILKIRNNCFEIVKTDGHGTIGGSKFNKLIMELVQQKYSNINMEESDCSLLPQKDEGIIYNISLAKLLSECEKVKIQLSEREEAEIDVDGYLRFVDNTYRQYSADDMDNDDENMDNYIRLTITRDEFEDLIRQDIMTTINIVTNCCDDANIRISDINSILMVGGSSYIPLIRRMLEEHFGKEKVCADINFQKCVAQGAARRSQMNVSEHFNTILERSPYDIALKGARNRFKTLIPRGTPLPTPPSFKTYNLPEDNTGEISCPIYECVKGKYGLVKNLVLKSEDIAFRKVSIRIEYTLTAMCELSVKYVDNDRDILIQEERLVFDN